MTDTTVEEIREARAKITEPPWYDENRSGFVVAAKDESGANDSVICQFWRKSDETDYQNALNNRPFIANAPRYIDFLLAELERLKAEKDDLHDKLSAERRANDDLRAQRAGVFNPLARR